MTLLAGPGGGRALAGGHRGSHGHGVAATSVTYVPVASGFQPVASASPTLFTISAAPTHVQFVQMPQIQMASPAIQASAPNASMFLIAMPQAQAVSSGPTPSFGQWNAAVGQQPVLGAGQLLFQQQLLQQMESSGFLKNLKDKLAQRLNDLRAQNNGILPARDQIVKFLLDEAFAFLKATPFGPFLAFLQPAIEQLIEVVIKEQPPIVPPGPIIPGGTPGVVKRYIITIQEYTGDTPAPAPLIPPPGPAGAIKADKESPLETPAAYPGR